MCGIFGYIGEEQDALDNAVRALRNISYRGYDSYGFAYERSGSFAVIKDKGDIEHTAIDIVPTQKVIAHTRWATHGKPLKKNAHPHVHDGIYIVHNGTIDNYLHVKKLPILSDAIYTSDTDSEVIAHLVAYYAKQYDLLEALRQTCSHLEGSYAIIAMDERTHTLAFAKKGSPLILGLDKQGGYFICSDILGFPHDRVDEVIYLENNQLGLVNSAAQFIDMHGNAITKRRIIIPKDIDTAQKGDFAHYMQKEIYDQRKTLRRLPIHARMHIMELGEYIKQHKYIVFSGCGTAYNVCKCAQYLFSELDTSQKRIYMTEIPADLGVTTPDTEDTLVISVTQSGETADLVFGLEQLQHAHKAAVLNTLHSTVDRMVDVSVHIGCGPEKAVASTKATSAQIASMFLLAHYVTDSFDEGCKNILNIASEIADLLNPRYETYIRKVANALCEKKHIFVVGKRTNYAMALEAMIKLAEVTYIHAQGFDSAEFKHGPFALIDTEDATPVIALMGDPQYDETHSVMLTQLEEMKSKGACIIGIGPVQHEIFDLWLRVPPQGRYAALVNLIPVQLLSYHIGLARGKEIDKPRNLAKSVTTR